MRRALATFLLLFFTLGPLTAALPAIDDARLPACCRRNGAHRCVLSAQMAAMLARMAQQDSTPAFTIPATCPNYSAGMIALLAPDAALMVQPLSIFAIETRSHAPAASRAPALEDPIRAHTVRGPPASL